MTLDDLKRREGEGDGAGKQRFFAGGERSAMYVEGGDDDEAERTKRAVEQVFGKAKGQQERASQEAPRFSGRSHKLTDEGNDDNEDVIEQQISSEDIASRVVIFWQDGLSIESEPLRPYTDPSTQRLLQQLSNEQVPLREFNLKPNQLVDIKVVHCLERPFSEEERLAELKNLNGDKKKKEPERFTGAARKLTDDTHTEATNSALVPGQRLEFDPNLPSTRLQLRLANGQRVVEQVNTSITVGQLLRHMQALNPLNYTGTMMTGMPPTPITADHEMTLEEAGLLNAVIMQK